MTRHTSNKRTAGHASASASDDNWLEGIASPDTGEPVPVSTMTKAELARLTALPPKAIDKMTREGLPQAGRGQFDIGELIRWLNAERTKIVETDPLDAARERKLLAAAKREELNYKKDAGLLWDAAETRAAIQRNVNRLRGELLDVSERLTGETAHVRAAVRAEIVAAFERLNAGLKETGVTDDA